MNEDKLDKIIADHQEWLLDNTKGARANLSSASLSGASLSGANLRRADLSGASLSGASLSGANLRRADLSGANLSGASLSGADLRRADLSGASLSYASLSGASLSYADLRSADLHSASLSGASLSYADLRSADLHSANLRYANLRGANLSSAKIADVFWCAPTVVLLARWGKCSDALTVQLMMYDASNHHNPKSFDVWADDGTCPFGDVRYQRAVNFTESVKLWPGWNPRKKIKSAYQLMQLLLEEHCNDEAL